MRFLVCVVATVLVGVLNAAFNVVNADQSKEVNIPLQTVLKFDERNQPRDLAIIDQVQDVLQKIKDAMRRRSGRRRYTDDMSFTNFVLKAAKILRNYNDNDLEDVYAVIDDESRRYINTESGLQGIIDNDMRRYFSNQLDSVKDFRANTLRRHLDKAISVLENDEHPREIKEVLDLGNSLYDGGGDKLRAALRNLEKARRSNGDILANILKGILKTLVFDYFSGMNQDVKGNLFQMALKFWNAFTSKSSKDKNPSSYPNNLRERKMTTRKDFGKWEVKSYAGTNRSRYKKIGPKKPNDNHKLEIFLTKSDIKKITNNTDLMEASRHKKDKPYKSYNQGYSKNLKEKKIPRKHKRGKNYTQHKVLRERSYPDDSSESNESFLLIGGQATQDLHLRVNPTESSSERSEENKHKLQESRENYEKLLSIEQSSTNSKRSSGSYSSSEGTSRSRSEDSNKSEEDNTSGPRKSPILLDKATVEGLSIDSFENDDNIERKVIRKNNDNDTVSLDVNPNAPENVVKLIENIEKEIEKVKEDVEYVKNLKEDGLQDKPKFKTVESEESPYHKSSNKSSNINAERTKLNSDSLERDNDDFFSAESKEKVTRMAFRAHDDTGNNNYSTKLQVEQNSTITKIVKYITETTTSSNKVNRTDENNTAENATVTSKDNVSDSDNLFIYRTAVTTNDNKSKSDKNNEIDKENYDNAVTFVSDGKKLKENVKTTTIGKMKNTDGKIVGKENVTLTARVKLA